MKKAARTFFLLITPLFVVALVSPPKISAQTCTGPTPRCGSREVRTCVNASGQTCLPGSLGCTCVDSCEGTTWTCNSCSDAPANGGCAAQYACTGIGTCVCIISGSCTYTGGGPTPTPSGGCTTGSCSLGIANCGEVGKDPGTGTCVGGLCCVDRGGGIPVEYCDVTLAPENVNLRVGQVFDMTVYTSGSGEYTGATGTTTNSAVATMSVTAAQDDDPPYSATIVGRAAGTATVGINVQMSDGHTCTDTTTVNVVPTTPAPDPSCTIVATPGSITGDIGTARTIRATVTPQNGTVARVAFASLNTAVATAVSPDATVPYTSDISLVGYGTTQIRVAVVMNGAVRCTDVVPITVPTPTCTVNFGNDRTISLGNTANAVATVTASSAPVDNIRFDSINTSVATVNPAIDAVTPYSTTIRAIADGQTVIVARVFIDGAMRCSDAIRVTVPAPSCTINLSPDPLQGIIGQQNTMAAATTQSGGTISNIQYVSGNSSIATVTSPDASAPYTTLVTGLAEGSTTVIAEGVMGGVARCQDTATVNIVPPEAWFRVSGAGVISGDNLDSPIPPTCVLPGCDPHFILDELYADPGIALYNGTVADFSSSSSSEGSVSVEDWLAQTPTFLNYSYELFSSLIPSNAPIQTVSGALAGGYLDGARPTDPKGYTWYVANGALTLNGNTTLTGSRKVILFVPGNLAINGRLNLSGINNFLLVVVGGDIIINPDVTNGNNPALEGLFYAQGSLGTGTRGGTNQDSRLIIRGSVAATSMLLERNLRAQNASTPAETIQYSNSLMFNYPAALASKRLIWRETAP